MKIRFFISILLLAALFTGGCKKKYDTVSVVKTVPSITLNGDKFISINVGGTYNEAGAVFIGENGQSSTIQPDSNNVDVNTPGLYIVTYSRVTESQFSKSDVRYVAVTNISDNLDLSGEYERDVNGEINTVSKQSRGLYLSDNFGGSSLVISAYFVQTNDSTIVIPEQPTEDGVTSGEEGHVSYSGTDTTISYRVISHSFGTGVRTFIK